MGALLPAITIALIGSINSLLTALIADSMTGGDHDPNRELMGVGLGNVLAGLIGAVPGAGATTGTVANIRAGGRTRVSGSPVRSDPARSGPWPRPVRRHNPPCGARRHLDEDRFRNRRLALH